MRRARGLCRVHEPQLPLAVRRVETQNITLGVALRAPAGPRGGAAGRRRRRSRAAANPQGARDRREAPGAPSHLLGAVRPSASCGGRTPCALAFGAPAAHARRDAMVGGTCGRTLPSSGTRRMLGKRVRRCPARPDGRDQATGPGVRTRACVRRSAGHPLRTRTTVVGGASGERRTGRHKHQGQPVWRRVTRWRRPRRYHGRCSQPLSWSLDPLPRHSRCLDRSFRSRRSLQTPHSCQRSTRARLGCARRSH